MRQTRPAAPGDESAPSAKPPSGQDNSHPGTATESSPAAAGTGNTGGPKDPEPAETRSENDADKVDSRPGVAHGRGGARAEEKVSSWLKKLRPPGLFKDPPGKGKAKGKGD